MRDEEFISSFKEYVELLVEESCREIRGNKEAPSDKLFLAGTKLVAHGCAAGIPMEATMFVGTFNDLAENGMLVPEPGAACSTPSGNSIRKLGRLFEDIEGYFKKAGLTFAAGVSDFEGRDVLQMWLGEAETIGLPAGPDVVLLTKPIVENTRDTIANVVLESGNYSDWTDQHRIYHQLGPKLQNGKAVWSDLKARSSLRTSFEQTGNAYVMDETAKLEELAWTELSLGSEREEDFCKKYAAGCIEDAYPHEIHHTKIAKDESGSFAEAAAQLYAIKRGSNPFNCLRSLYVWKGVNQHKYSFAAEVAFKQLEKAGYSESLWRELDPIDAEAVNATGSEIRRLAGVALGNIEDGLQWKKHEEAEMELGLEKNYSVLHEELHRELGGYGK